MLWYFCKFSFVRNVGIMLVERILFNSLKHGGKYIYHLILTLENSTFCPHVVWIAFSSDYHNEQNFRKGVNSLVFVMGTQCVCREVQIKIFIHFQIHFWSEMQFSHSRKHQNLSSLLLLSPKTQILQSHGALVCRYQYRDSNNQPVSQPVSQSV